MRLQIINSLIDQKIRSQASPLKGIKKENLVFQASLFGGGTVN